MAYWTVGEPIQATEFQYSLTCYQGFPLSITYYFRRIKSVALRISDISEQVLPTNRALVDRFVGSVALQRTELILTAAYQVKEQVRWDDDLFNKFSGYVTAQERRMRESLQTVKYNIDTPRAMVLLLGSEAVEKVREYFTLTVKILTKWCLEFASFPLSAVAQVLRDHRCSVSSPATSQ